MIAAFMFAEDRRTDMSYKLDKPHTDKDFADFVCKYNHRKGLEIQETDKAVFALEKNEMIVNGTPIINPNYEYELAEKRRQMFEKEFFETSLGWIRRTVTMKDGSTKDFLSDMLMQIKAGIELGKEVMIVTYKQPDFYKDIQNNYEHLQERKPANIEFILECLNRTVMDFDG